MSDDQQPDFYDILGVDRNATPEEVTRAYRKAIRAAHPDTSGTSGLFRMVKTAYDTLSDPGARASYDAGRRTVPPQSEPAPPKPEPAPQPSPRSTRETSGPDRPVTPKPPAGTAQGPGPRVRPRFGAHWGWAAAIAAWAVVFSVAVYALWPAAVPTGMSVLLFLPMIAAPLIATQPGLGSRSWPWSACAVPFVGAAVLVVGETNGSEVVPFYGVLAGLVLGGAGLALAPSMIRRGRELDRLVGPDCLVYEIFNTPGAGLAEPGAREAARITGAGLDRLALVPGVRIVHSLSPPASDRSSGYVAHALLRDNRLALVTVGELAAEELAVAVQAFRPVLPRGIQVRGFAVLEGSSYGRRPGRLSLSDAMDLFTGSLNQVRAELATWLEPAAPVIRRRALAVLLGHVRT